MNQKIDQIVKEFDFESCHKIMLLLNWRYGYGRYIPTLQDIKKVAVEGLTRVVNSQKECEYSYCGGFLAVKYDGEVSLYFCPKFKSIKD